MDLEERIALHRRMAEAYRDAYLLQEVEQGAMYESWKFADDGVYSSPYFTGDQAFPLSEYMSGVAEVAPMEAKAYSLTFPDWKPSDFKYWPADNGFVMKVRWEGHTNDGKKMGFYSYSFVETNDKGEVSHWETHVNEEYSPFLDVAIGVSGPFHGIEGAAAYVDALRRTLEKAGASS